MRLFSILALIPLSMSMTIFRAISSSTSLPSLVVVSSMPLSRFLFSFAFSGKLGERTCHLDIKKDVSTSKNRHLILIGGRKVLLANSLASVN